MLGPARMLCGTAAALLTLGVPIAGSAATWGLTTQQGAVAYFLIDRRVARFDLAGGG